MDSFNLPRTVVLGCIDDFIALVVPRLQERGAYKTKYEPGALLGKLLGREDRLRSNHAGALLRLN